MTPEEKLARIEQLLPQYQAVKAELFGLLGTIVPASVPVSVSEPEEPPAKRKYTKRAPGFTDAQVFPTRKNKGKGCPECGSPTVHRKGCSRRKEHRAPQAQEPAGNTAKDSTDKMSRMTFGRVKISQSHEVEPETIARNLDLDIAEVERAFDYETYSDYERS